MKNQEIMLISKALKDKYSKYSKFDKEYTKKIHEKGIIYKDPKRWWNGYFSPRDDDYLSILYELANIPIKTLPINEINTTTNHKNLLLDNQCTIEEHLFLESVFLFPTFENLLVLFYISIFCLYITIFAIFQDCLLLQVFHLALIIFLRIIGFFSFKDLIPKKGSFKVFVSELQDAIHFLLMKNLKSRIALCFCVMLLIIFLGMLTEAIAFGTYYLQLYFSVVMAIFFGISVFPGLLDEFKKYITKIINEC